jgi:ATP-dependent DNA helicase UvrD/PcrA
VRPRSTALDRLTAEQLIAAASRLPRLFIEAEPGSGKTTVAAYRFGALRYGQSGGEQPDHRAVVAVSFTRSATYELHARVRRVWGPRSLDWPNRIITIDTLLVELLHELLRSGRIGWPGGHTELVVEDSWRAIAAPDWTRYVSRVVLRDDDVRVQVGRAARAAARVAPDVFSTSVRRGVCTHDEVRSVLEAALQRDDITSSIIERLRRMARVLIVDEVFDANALDLRLIDLAARAGLQVSIIGDPWQALYGFRGATPEAVPALVERLEMSRLPLTASFRWRTMEQAALARALRRGEGVVLPAAGGPSDADVVLASEWQALWDAGDEVLPLAYGSAKGSPPEAAATLLLNQLSRTIFGDDATYAGDALTTLRIVDPNVFERLDAPLRGVLDQLRTSGKSALNQAYADLVAALSPLTDQEFKKAHGAYTKRLDALRPRLGQAGNLIIGMTTHQAKGREWERVAVKLTDEQRAALARGLRSDREADRQLYVACTRARSATVAL